MAEEKKVLTAPTVEDLCNMYGVKAEMLENYVKNGVIKRTDSGVQLDLTGVPEDEKAGILRFMKDGKVGGCGCGCGCKGSC